MDNRMHKQLKKDVKTQEPGKEMPFFKPLNVSKQSTNVFGLDYGTSKSPFSTPPMWHAVSGTGSSQYLTYGTPLYRGHFHSVQIVCNKEVPLYFSLSLIHI